MATGAMEVLRAPPGSNIADVVAAETPDVVIVDMALPDRDALEGIRAVTSREPRPIVMFVDQDDPGFMEEAIAAGVSSYNVVGVTLPEVKPIVTAAPQGRAGEGHPDAAARHRRARGLSLAAPQSHERKQENRRCCRRVYCQGSIRCRAALIAMSRTMRSDQYPLRLGLLKLTDAAPVIMAHELGFFAAAGVDVAISVEPSWANIADKLAYGLLDGAILLPPLAVAISLGLRGAASCPLVVPMSLSLGGNTVTLSSALARSMPLGSTGEGALAASKSLATFLATRRSGDRPTLAVVHAFSTHNLLLRYWLAAGGINPEGDVNFVVVPPARVVEAIREKRIDGFCAGAPWGHVAELGGLGMTVVTSYGIWRNGPEKIFAVPAAWAERHPETLQALLRALLRAARFCDEPVHAAAIAAILSRETYLDMTAEMILSSVASGNDSANEAGSVLLAHAAPVPWRSHALWMLREMARWGFLSVDLDFSAIANAIYRPDLYAIAAAQTGVSTPLVESKTEGTHHGTWALEARTTPITMGPDLFCDGRVFDPTASFELPAPAALP